MACCEKFTSKLWRRKTLPRDPLETPLRRCLNVFDLSMLGIGNMVGAGVFILSGVIAREVAGPGIVLSYLLAGIAMMLSSMCYAEFGARIPKAGSAYIFTYVTMGELCGFIVGWSVILERMLSGAAVARGWSSMFDAMFNHAIQNSTMDTIGEINVPGMSSYLDFIAFTVTIIVIVVVSAGVACLAKTNLVFTSLNMITLFIVIALGFWKADWNNWSSEALGGFLPYGFQGVLAGTATLFYTYVGFESITNAAEEAQDPSSQIPVASIVAISFTTIVYMCCAAGLTLMLPFYILDVASPFPSAFRQLGLDWAVYVVVIGGLLGITTSILMDMFALPRNIYAMASDGLFFKIFAHVHPETKTPIVATVIFGLLTAILALLVDYKTLVEFLSIGILISFTFVAICVIANRYRPPDDVYVASQSDSSSGPKISVASATLQHARDTIPTDPVLKVDFKDNRLLRSLPGGAIIYLSVIMMIVCTVVLSLLLKYSSLYDIYGSDRNWVMVVVFVCLMGVFTALFFLSAYEELNEPATFSVPLVPYTPSLSIMINVALLVQLPEAAWIRYGIWLAVGIVIYLVYGIRHSSENRSLVDDSTLTLMSYSALARNDELDNDTSHMSYTSLIGNDQLDDVTSYTDIDNQLENDMAYAAITDELNTELLNLEESVEQEQDNVKSKGKSKKRKNTSTDIEDEVFLDS